MFQNYSKAFHLNFAVGVSSAVFAAFLFTGCEEEKQTPVVREVRRIKGEVEVLNSCSMKGAAVKMRSFLRNNGFDVVHIDNELTEHVPSVGYVRHCIVHDDGPHLGRRYR